MKTSLIPLTFLILSAVFVFGVNFDGSKLVRVLAETAPELLITWSAQNYTPPDYAGKSMPTRGTSVGASVELIENGRLADLSKQEIRWILNNRLHKSGVGLKNVSLIVPELTRDNQILRVSIVNFRGKDIEKSVILPVVDPEVVINVPYPRNKIQSGENLFIALAYFFNVANLNDLSFVWSANGRNTQSEDRIPNLLKLNASGGRAGDKVDLSARVSNKKNPAELGAISVGLEIQ